MNKTENKVFSRFTAKADFFLKLLIVCLGASLALLMVGQVVLRYLVESPFAGIEEIAILFGVWGYFIGMGYASLKGEHICGGIVTLLVSDPVKIKCISWLVSMVCLASVVIFGYFALDYFLYEFSRDRSSIYLQWPRWIWSASVVAGFFIMLIFYLYDIFHKYKLVMAAHNKDDQ